MHTDTTKANEKRALKQQYLLPLTPLREGPEYDHVTCNRKLQGNLKERLWDGVFDWFKTRKKNDAKACSSSNCGDGYATGDDAINGKKYGRSDTRRRMLLGVLGCPLAPISVDVKCSSSDFHYNIKDVPIERSTAQYIIHQYLAATGCLKMISIGSQQQPGYYKNMYTTGTVKMTCCETEISSVEGESVTDSGRGSQATDNVNGCFVLWQMVPRMWSLELVLSSGNKVMAGSDGNTVWSYTPSMGTQISKGPQRPLRRIIQGLDPKSTAMLFAKAERLADKKIGDEECFVLKVCAGKDDVMARNYGPGNIAVEVLRHVLYGYFSQKSGLLVYMEDSQLTRAMVENDTDSSFSSDDENMEEVMYWETSIGSSIGDYREVEGLMVAHQGRSIATVFEVQQPYMYRTRFEELWKIDDIAFNIPGLSSHSFLPPSH
ncbi:hypothetical protein CTI12_AA428110 [Artemisia annua]|uniref:Uncharacterized protein n=1 Tax=Artemisia annua TaxID=35608 RepID=A0A2U1M2K8_ARTAN|nr:hypothetical protein CTI12_AA428110 [Artemisia annua]